jgi:hypothetical protein
VTAALGSAAGGRTQAAASETASVGAQKRAQKSYDDASAALAKLAPSRAIPEIEADIAGLLARNAKQIDCTGAVTTPLQRFTCPRVAVLKGEIARTEKRAELDKALADASDKLAAPPPPPANTDSAALRRFTLAVGLDISADRLNDLLVLLAVLVVEFGGGLSLTTYSSMEQSGCWMLSTTRVPESCPRRQAPRDRRSAGAAALPSARQGNGISSRSLCALAAAQAKGTARRHGRR